MFKNLSDEPLARLARDAPEDSGSDSGSSEELQGRIKRDSTNSSSSPAPVSTAAPKTIQEDANGNPAIAHIRPVRQTEPQTRPAQTSASGTKVEPKSNPARLSGAEHPPEQSAHH